MLNSFLAVTLPSGETKRVFLCGHACNVDLNGENKNNACVTKAPISFKNYMHACLIHHDMCLTLLFF
jgi:hypothetical protein